jgi:hypothetical protein
MSGTAKEVVEAINGYLNTNSRSGELLIAQSSTWQSEHPRKNSSKIELHHSMLLV